MFSGVTVHGKCSRCGGRVVTPSLYGGVVPPRPRCETCGAVMVDRGLPTVETVIQPDQQPFPTLTRKTLGLIDGSR